MNPSTVPSTRRDRRKHEIRERILGAAIELFNEQSCGKTHIDDICTRADVARNTLYNYFPSKHHLIIDVTDRVVFDETRHLVEKARAHSTDTVARLCFYIDAIANLRRKSANLKRTLLREAVPTDQSFDAKSWFHLSKLLADLIDEGQVRGDVGRKFSAEYLGELLAGSINAIALSWSHNDRYPIGKRLRELKESFVLLLQA